MSIQHLLRHTVVRSRARIAGTSLLVEITFCTRSSPTASTPAPRTLTKRAAGTTPPPSIVTRARTPGQRRRPSWGTTMTSGTPASWNSR
ncbi:hypothetical protein Esi_0096_0083 [Ectocarpus siliculosus]|uniref:Uncharacterized protein n=1 Tax=Ectocarpus siliculosus TaxID=2880 RepID=D7G970_ECTSI|nr:hypothetical protein Esi_0096_0083 [Ectocarpus siliculosus]|eukprot:CBJ28234.1 hypothetical protein Esi_0096_0083 [Ectocarpus siliculosus]